MVVQSFTLRHVYPIFVMWLVSNCALRGGRADLMMPVCNESNYSPQPSRPVPPLPSQFSTVLQASLFTRNQEIIVREYFDDVGNRGRLELASDGMFVYSILDYEDREIFFLPDPNTGEECSVDKITEDNHFLRETFGLRTLNGSAHIGTVANFFNLVNTPLQYIGPEAVRGIPCNRWQSCVVLNTTSYTLDYYFSRNDTNWTSAFGDDPVPVQITLNGIAPNYDEQGNSSDGFHRVYHNYSFIAFHTGPTSVPDAVFRLPTGISCKGRIPGKALPPLPDYFTTFFEGTDREEQTVSIFKDYYDLDFQLFRTDFYNERSYLPEGPYTLIHDFNLETQYVINRRFQNCSITAIQAGTFDAAMNDGMPRLAAPSDLLLLSDNFNYSYEGVSVIRGVNVESWISYREFEAVSFGNLTDTLYEVFFTRPEWSIGTISSAHTSEPILWQIRISGILTSVNSSTNLTQSEKFSAIYDTFSFSSSEPHLDEFDTSMCVAQSDYYSVAVTLPVEGIQVDVSILSRNVRSSVAKYTGVKPLQIGNIHVFSSNSTQLAIGFHISNLSNVSLPFVESPVTADQAIQKLSDFADKNDNKLDFEIELAPGQSVTPNLVFIRGGASGETVFCSSTDDSDNDDGLSDGAIAGIAIWMLVLGVGIGIIGTLIVFAIIPCVRKKSFKFSSPVSYKKQKDDVVAD